MHEDTKVDIGMIPIFFGFVAFIFFSVDGILVLRMGFSHTHSLFALILITMLLLNFVWRERTRYYEDLLRISFDDETIERAKWLKERKVERESNQ